MKPNQDSAAAYSFFGNKLMVTSESKDSTLNGFTILEIDGKLTNAIVIGESLVKGQSLQGVSDESQTE